MSSMKLISSGQAREIIAKIAHRPRISRASLKYLVDTGKLQSFPIHPTRHRYDPAQVLAVAHRLAEIEGLEPGELDSARAIKLLGGAA